MFRSARSSPAASTRAPSSRRWPKRAAPTGRLAGGLPLALKGARSLRHLALSPADACARKHGYGLFDADARGSLYSPDFAEAVRDADPFAGFRAAYDACQSLDPLDRALYV